MSKKTSSRSLRQGILEAQAALESLEMERKKLRRRRNEKLLNNTFWGILLIIIVIAGGLFLYNNRSNIVDAIHEKTGVDLASVFSRDEKPPEASDTTQTNCSSINVEVTENSRLKVTPTPKVGQCYSIAEDLRQNWSKVVESEKDRFAQFIYDNSSSKELDVATIIQRLTDSVSTGTLDLRNQVQDPTQTPESASTEDPDPSGSAQATEIPPTPTPEPSPTPTIPPTPQVIVVPWPEKERGYSLEELARVMSEHNIPTVSGENKLTSAQDRVTWALYYTVSEGVQDYVVFRILNSPLPETCSSGTNLTISLVALEDPAAMKMTVGTETKYDIFFVCK